MAAAQGGSAEIDAQDGVYSEYLQWLLVEARAQTAYDEAKAAAGHELGRLADEAAAAKRGAAEAQRKLKLMRELAGLAQWMAANRASLAAMAAQIGGVRAAYAAFSDGVAHAARAMPVAGVHFAGPQALQRDLEAFAAAVGRAFPAADPAVQRTYAAAARLRRLYEAQRLERDLLCECRRLRESLAHASALALSRGSAGSA
ncbi:hypothetical protein H4R18_005248 [Coemansia javaensis]|uniref:Uncharacterized protein n=1 Tax=Coemansia javaensis TaxID=2761396 RepID=A0A9W8H9S0_9FUNG|nr:hypothetical protein H4R18_005248 [Coemansia javaensis]